MINFRHIRGAAVVFLTMGLLISCAPKQKYAWGSYENALYSYYKDPESLESLKAELEATIAEGEKSAMESSSADGTTSNRIAPGLYAEYGYLLMLGNEGDRARSYFEKEKQSWPESTVLMDKMIKVVDQQSR